jgi:hypothetical protein
MLHMTQLDYYRYEPQEHLPHRGGLAAWGITMIVLGALAGIFACFAVLFWALLVMHVVPGFAASGQSPSVMLAGAGFYILSSVILIWLGRGSQTGKRWVRPVMISGTIITAFSGLASIAPLIIGAVSVSNNPGSVAPYATTVTTTTGPSGTVTVSGSSTVTVTRNYTAIGLFSGACSIVVLMEALPLTMLWFYGRSSVQATLDRLDPNPRWTDRCPQSVLTWSMACIFLGLGLAMASAKAVVPFFSAVLVGPPAVAALLLLALLLSGGGYLCYRLNSIGWVMTFIACLILFASYLTFGVLGDKQLYLDLMFASMPQSSRSLAEQMAPSPWPGPVVLYAFGAGYAAFILKWFGGKKYEPSFPSATTSEPHAQ